MVNIKIINLRNNKFKVESSKKGKFYQIDLNEPSCSCPHFLFRMRQTGGICKHIEAVQSSIGNKQNRKTKIKTKDFNAIIRFVKQKGSVDAINLIDKYGENKVEHLIRKGELIEKKGKIFVLG